MKKFKLALAALSATALVAVPAGAGTYGKKDKKTIVQVASSSDQFETLVAAVKAADLAGTLSSEGPFTVFAPVDAAFDKLPEGTVSTLLKPENKGTLTAVLTYHVVSGRYTSGQLVAAAKQNGGTATLTTVQGGTIKAMLHGNDLMLHDAKGNRIGVVKANVNTSNGVIHAIDGVLMP